VFRFWQEGPGYESKSDKPETVRRRLTTSMKPGEAQAVPSRGRLALVERTDLYPIAELLPVVSPRVTPLPAEFLDVKVGGTGQRSRPVSACRINVDERR